MEWNPKARKDPVQERLPPKSVSLGIGGNFYARMRVGVRCVRRQSIADMAVTPSRTVPVSTWPPPPLCVPPQRGQLR